jgi:hypothetical protein
MMSPHLPAVDPRRKLAPVQLPRRPHPIPVRCSSRRQLQRRLPGSQSVFAPATAINKTLIGKAKKVLTLSHVRVFDFGWQSFKAQKPNAIVFWVSTRQIDRSLQKEPGEDGDGRYNVVFPRQF